MSRPNFFIVGSPKCGTTAIYHYLNEHPDVYMSPVKEPYYFGKDLIYKEIRRMSEGEYLKLFREAKNEKVIGEASITYLVSTEAAEEIKAFSPDAKILIMLRKPVDMMHSMHSQALYTQVEDVSDFESALSLEAERKNGGMVPRKTTILNFLFYKEFARYSEQVRRYYSVFGRDNVHIILYDDFRKNAGSVYKELLDFLCIDSTFRPKRFAVINANKKRKNAWLSAFLQNPVTVAVVRLVLPSYKLRQGIAKKIALLTVKNSPRAAINDELRMRLTTELTDEVKQLENLINRDLSQWLEL
jgi:hypothetical protein